MILVRHAESEWNRAFGRTRVDPGIRDPGLTDLGHEQARLLIARLAAEGVTRLIASPYRRTLETATTVAGALGLPVVVEPLVRERCFFSCDIGTPPDELSTIWPDLAFDHLEPAWWGGGEESEHQLARRVVAFRDAAERLPDRQSVAVISHWGFIRALTGADLANGTYVRLARRDGLRETV